MWRGSLVEKRSLTPLVLAGTGLAVAILVIVLLFEVRSGSGPVTVAQTDLDRAAAAHARGAAPPVTPSRASQGLRPHVGVHPASPPPSRPALNQDDDDDSDDGVPPPVAPDDGVLGRTLARSNGPATIAKQIIESNQAYDWGDYETALSVATEILDKQPDDVRTLRIATSSACIMGEAEKAKVYYGRLPPRDQRQIARRCRRYGVEF